MNLLKPCNYFYTNSYHPPFHSNHNSNNFDNRILKHIKFHRPNFDIGITKNVSHVKRIPTLRAYNAKENEAEEDKDEDEANTQRKTFLSLEEAGLVEISGLSTHERFLCRLTISSLNLLRVIAEQEMCSIEELNAGRICDWFMKDKLKREQNIGSAVLQWDEDDPFQGQF